MLPRILVTWPFDLDLLAPLEGRSELTRNPQARVWTQEELGDRILGIEILLCVLNDRVDRALLESAPKLRMVANVAVGYDNLEINALRERSIVASNTPGVLTDATADLTMALILAATRRVAEADRFAREGRFAGMRFDLFLGAELSGKILGVVGYGRIGRAVAARAVGFGMKVIHAGRSSTEQTQGPQSQPSSSVLSGVGSTSKAVSLDELLAQADIVSLHLPLSSRTRHLIDARRLARMKPTAYLINTSRGPIVDEAALASALREGRLAGAGLDVYEFEPRIYPGLLGLPKVVLLPHIGSATHEARRRMVTLAVDNAIDYLDGKRPRNILPELIAPS